MISNGSAGGMSPGATKSNVLRYQFGRMKYHALEALKLSPTAEEAGTLEMILDGIGDLMGERPLEGGDVPLAHGGKKAKVKAAAETTEE